MDIETKIKRLEDFKDRLHRWEKSHDADARTYINQQSMWIRREVIEAGCFHTLTIGPPPAVGGMIMRNVDPFSAIFNPPYGASMLSTVVDLIDKTIGVLQADPPEPAQELSRIQVEPDVQKGYAFIAMPIAPGDPLIEDVLDAIKDAAKRCGIHAERVDEPQSNDKITDRILESIRKAEYVIVDLTGSRPNVFYEAGYAQGLGKTPIYVAREGTKLEFDLKDYPVIFFRGMKELKDSLENRLRGLGESKKT